MWRAGVDSKTSNHMKAPKSAAFVAEMRQVFGAENVEVLYVKEGNVELGEKQPDGAPCFTFAEPEKKKPKKRGPQLEMAA